MALIGFHCTDDEDPAEGADEYALTVVDIPQPRHYLFENLSVSLCLVSVQIIFASY